MSATPTHAQRRATPTAAPRSTAPTTTKHAWRHLLPIVFCCFISIFSACQQQPVNPLDAPRQALQSAIDAQLRNDVDAYIAQLDCGTDADTLSTHLLRTLILQQQQRMLATHGGLQYARIDTIQLRSDSVAEAFYTEFYANGDSIPCFHKLVRTAGTWRIRIRN